MSKQTELAQVADTITVDSGNVGIGTSSIAAKVHIESASASITPSVHADELLVEGSGNSGITVGSGTSSDGSLRFSDSGGDSRGQVNYSHSSDSLRFYTADSLAATIDASGNLLVGKTNTDRQTDGHEQRSDGFARHTRDGNNPLELVRRSSDGDIIKFYKDGTTVGSIGNSGNYMYLASQGSGSRGVKITDNFIPATITGANNDNAMDLGGASVRWDDVYATNGTIQTSDRNEKQDIAELSDAEQRVSVAAKGLMRKFRWRDAVEAKGDNARTHFGIIAQDLQAAFVAEGLDAGDYAMFISTTWWETQTEVPAVEAVAEVLDEDGNVITEAVEAVDAYTRTDTYETQEEAPEGATERTRLGVRYSELLAFIIGAL